MTSVAWTWTCNPAKYGSQEYIHNMHIFQRENKVNLVNKSVRKEKLKAKRELIHMWSGSGINAASGITRTSAWGTTPSLANITLSTCLVLSTRHEACEDIQFDYNSSSISYKNINPISSLLSYHTNCPTSLSPETPFLLVSLSHNGRPPNTRQTTTCWSFQISNW